MSCHTFLIKKEKVAWFLRNKISIKLTLQEKQKVNHI